MNGSVHQGLKPMTRTLAILAVLSPLALAVPALVDAIDDSPGHHDTPGNDPATGNAPAPGNAPGNEGKPTLEPATPAPLALRAPGQRLLIEQTRPIVGFAINAHHISDLSLYLKSVDRVAAIGANALIVLTPMFMDKADSNDIRFVESRCATDEQLVAILRKAQERGLHTTLLPIVLIEHPGDKDWRGVIRPGDWDQWWRSYNLFIDRFINIANQANVDLLAMGSELNSTEDQIDHWTQIARRVRSGFAGQLTYSANWDRFDKIRFWNLVDVMAVSSYFELDRDNPNASLDQLVRAWQPEQTKMLDFARTVDRPLLLSEVGYPSLSWASAHPWNYVAKEGTKADHQAQARCWEAFFAAWSTPIADRHSPALGLFCYHWNPYYHGDAWDTTYGIEGKPAYEIIKRGFAAIRTATTTNASASAASPAHD